ncbi:hypothetical protein DER29_0462 [Micromonospora sp. M71_S20]|uniref:hypothetical protein n=1 Tax=Micromonospora sp. M71_S20 TaxID=592872 RepID=UPI000EAC2323|nr:hypothetical protein [Micromonospora sp. M71_S20]RLK22625.1 hypothetical protein DER29_0462 [Micromonospora sp. M71_S20]
MKEAAAVLAWVAAGSFGVFLFTLSLTDLVTGPDVWAATRVFVLGVCLVALVRAPFVKAAEETEEVEE